MSYASGEFGKSLIEGVCVRACVFSPMELVFFERGGGIHQPLHYCMDPFQLKVDAHFLEHKCMRLPPSAMYIKCLQSRGGIGFILSRSIWFLPRTPKV